MDFLKRKAPDVGDFSILINDLDLKAALELFVCKIYFGSCGDLVDRHLPHQVFRALDDDRLRGIAGSHVEHPFPGKSFTHYCIIYKEGLTRRK